MSHPRALCAIDFSEPSRGALRYAAALAEHFYGDLVVLTVEHPWLLNAAGISGQHDAIIEESKQALQAFVDETFAAPRPVIPALHVMASAGRASVEIIRAAVDQRVDLVVMASHGSGGRRHFFGSTTERVLRDTRTPVLVTPAPDAGPAALEDLRAPHQTVLAPIDLTAASPRQAQVAQGIAGALGSSLLLAHVIEPLPAHERHARLSKAANGSRRHAVDRAMAQLIEGLGGIQPEIVIAEGHAAEEIVRIADERAARLVVMGLHGSPFGGPRMGSVTYRVVSLAHAPVLALPPAPAAAAPAGSARVGGEWVNA